MSTRTRYRTPYHFFLSHAGYSFDPQTETKLQGRQRCARALAAAERRAADLGVSFEWTVDPDCDSSQFTAEEPAWPLWQCVARTQDGACFASLGGIDFGRDVEPWGEPYRRVVEAELALELPEEK